MHYSLLKPHDISSVPEDIKCKSHVRAEKKCGYKLVNGRGCGHLWTLPHNIPWKPWIAWKLLIGHLICIDQLIHIDPIGVIDPIDPIDLPSPGAKRSQWTKSQWNNNILTMARPICAKNTNLPCIKGQWPCFIYKHIFQCNEKHFGGVISFQGYQGIQGFQGIQYFQGFQGIQGYQGFQGIQGSLGFQGRFSRFSRWSRGYCPKLGVGAALGPEFGVGAKPLMGIRKWRPRKL